MMKIKTQEQEQQKIWDKSYHFFLEGIMSKQKIIIYYVYYSHHQGL